jgi:hypothetical protein
LPAKRVLGRFVMRSGFLNTSRSRRIAGPQCALRDSLILIVGLVTVTTPIAPTVLVGAARFRDTAENVANVLERDVE